MPHFERFADKLRALAERLRAALKPQRPAIEPPPPASVDAQPATIEAYDGFGRLIQMPREQWRADILLPQIQHAWDTPEVLYDLVINASRDGFAADVLDASQHLAQGYPDRDVFVNAYGCVLMQVGRFDDATTTFSSYFAHHPTPGFMLSNLALAYKAQGKTRLATKTLTKAIQLDPNQKEGLQWWVTQAEQRGGVKARAEALRFAAAVPSSWRPQLMQASDLLSAGMVGEALMLYEAILPSISGNGEALTIVSGSLGQQGAVDELIQLVGPLYDPARHGPLTGMNLLQALLATRDVERGRKLLHELFNLNLPPYQSFLIDMSQRFDELRREMQPPLEPTGPPSALNLLVFERPLWYIGLSNPAWLVPAKPPRSRSIAFVSFAQPHKVAGVDRAEFEDDTGRLTRAVPLYLMESLLLRTDASPYALIPAVNGVGPALFGSAWNRDAIAGLAEHVRPETDIIVTGAITAQGYGFEVSATLWDAYELLEMETITREVAEAEIGGAVAEIERDLITYLELSPSDAAGQGSLVDERLPADELLAYLQCVGQSLALAMTRNGICPLHGLWGERALIGSPLSLALHHEASQAARLLFASNLWLDREAGSDIYTEFRLPAMTLLQYAAPGSPLYAVSPLLFKVFEMGGEYERRKEELLRTASGSYADWLAGI
ncbi:MAG TPA: hypothetical protein VGK19_11715 [Capsulimonadaceae bacterium]